MVSAFERSSLAFLGGVVALAIGGAVFLGWREPPEPSSNAGVPAQSQPARKEPLPAPVPKPADAPLSYDLEAVAAGAPVPRSFAAALPENIDAGDAGVGGEEMIRAMLPLVLLVNEEILAERGQLWSIRFKRKLGDHVPPEQQLWLRVVAERYGAEPEDLDELLRRMDVVPASIVLAVAGQEWESERHDESAKERTAGRADKSVNAASNTAIAPPSSKHALGEMPGKTLPSLVRSPLAYVRAIIHALNTAPAYESFRRARERMRLAGEPLDSLGLARAFPKLRGRLGAEEIAALITAHHLDRFDDARLQPSGPSG